MGQWGVLWGGVARVTGRRKFRAELKRSCKIVFSAFLTHLLRLLGSSDMALCPTVLLSERMSWRPLVALQLSRGPQF